MSSTPFLSVVAPMYNEEQTLPKFIAAVTAALAQVTEDYEVIFAVDPCTDRTIELLQRQSSVDPRIKAIIFSRRFGQPAATWAGLCHATGQVVVVIDSDLQDPPSLIPEMVRCWREGYKVVIPQRRSRKGENWVRRLIAYVAYKFINKIATVPIPRNTGDFRLLDRVVVDELIKLRESHGFLRGLTGIVGFKTQLLPFDRDPRLAGKTKHNSLTGSWRIGFNGIVAFSDYLLNLMVVCGFSMAVAAMLAMCLVVYLKASGSYQFAAGLPTVAIGMLFLSGMQFIGMGILGLYVGRIYDETKCRPKFIVEKTIGFGEDR